jgi:hypothetical protein
MEVKGHLQAQATLHFTREEGASGTHWIGGWVGSRAGLEAKEKIKVLPLQGIEPRRS